jgi:hypothetical protein
MNKMIPIFKDNQRQTFFEREGYTSFPLLSKSEVEELKSYYESLPLKGKPGTGFHVSMDNPDKEMCRRVREKIWSVTLPRFNEHLMNYKSHVASFAMKEVYDRGVTPPHLDWSFADREEDGYFSMSCWIALVDTTSENGGMGVLRGGSHKFMQIHRPSPTPPCPGPLGDLLFDIFPYMHAINMKAGEVLMFDNRTFHASPPNTSNGVRLAAGVGITQKDAQLIHYYLKPDGTKKNLLKYNVDEDFFMKYSNADIVKLYADGKLIEGYGNPIEVPYEYPKYTSQEMIRMIEAVGNKYDEALAIRLAKLFGIETNQHSVQVQNVESKKPFMQQQEKEKAWVDDRSFFKKYTAGNIVNEIKKRLTQV